MKIYFLTIILTTGLFSQSNGEDILLETVGALSAQGIYLTYSSIGTIADGYAGGTYDSGVADPIITELITLSQNAKDQLTLLLTSGILSTEDISYVAHLITGYNYLQSEAKAFSQFINTGDDKYIHEYEKYRLQAWDLISELFGLE